MLLRVLNVITRVLNEFFEFAPFFTRMKCYKLKESVSFLLEDASSVYQQNESSDERNDT